MAEENQENQEQENKEEKIEKERPNLPKELEKIQEEKIRGRIIIFDQENSEFAKHLGLKKPGDYTQKIK